jgi:hypothetical protein
LFELHSSRDTKRWLQYTMPVQCIRRPMVAGAIY